MTEPNDTSWPECTREGCHGIQLDANQACLAHATESERLDALSVLSQTGVVDVRGVPFTKTLLARVLTAATRDGKPVLKSARFDRSTFTDDAAFEEATFTGPATFDGATFNDRADFSNVTFTDSAKFSAVTFAKTASFHEAKFDGDTRFSAVTFAGPAIVGSATLRPGNV